MSYPFNSGIKSSVIIKSTFSCNNLVKAFVLLLKVSISALEGFKKADATKRFILLSSIIKIFLFVKEGISLSIKSISFLFNSFL